MMDSKIVFYAPASPTVPEQHKEIGGHLHFLLHGILRAAVAWVARLEKDGAAQANTDMGVLICMCALSPDIILLERQISKRFRGRVRVS